MAYGSEANPVRLDKWQNIIEVGWNTNFVEPVIYNIAVGTGSSGSEILPYNPSLPWVGANDVRTYMTHVSCWISNTIGEGVQMDILPAGFSSPVTCKLYGGSVVEAQPTQTKNFSEWEAHGFVSTALSVVRSYFQAAGTAVTMFDLGDNLFSTNGTPVMKVSPLLFSAEFVERLGSLSVNPGLSFDFSAFYAVEVGGLGRTFNVTGVEILDEPGVQVAMIFSE